MSGAHTQAADPDGAEVEVFKARRTVVADPVPSLRLTATKVFPDYSANPAQSSIAHIADAILIVNALYRSLPGGTLDQVLRLLLERKASQFVVRF